MKTFNKLKRYLKQILGIKPKPSLRELCIDKYGEEFGEFYDKSCRGEPIGTLTETLIFLHMIEEVRKEYHK